MRPFSLALAWCFVFVALTAAQDATRYSEDGITFDYPKGWKAMTDKPGGIPSISVQNDKGTQAVLQIHPADADPKAARTVLEMTFRKVFEGKLVPESEKAAKRKIAGAEREGVGMDFEVAKGVAIHFEFFAFPLGPKKPVICAVFQHAAFDADAAKTGFDLIAGSLADAAGSKTPAPATKTPAPVAKKAAADTPAASIVTLPSPPPGGWGFKAAKAGVRLWADRDYTLTKVPKPLEGGALLQRGVGDGKAWLPSGKLTVTQNGTAYAIVRWKYMGKEQLGQGVFDKLRDEGWSEVKEAAETTFPKGEAWEWKVIKKDIKKGEELGVLKSLTWDQPIVFVFKAAARP